VYRFIVHQRYYSYNHVTTRKYMFMLKVVFNMHDLHVTYKLKLKAKAKY